MNKICLIILFYSILPFATAADNLSAFTIKNLILTFHGLSSFRGGHMRATCL